MPITDLVIDLWNKNQLETQLLFGESIRVIEREGDWLYVEALDQPFYSDHWHGYRGFIKDQIKEGETKPNKRPVDRGFIIQYALEWLAVPYLLGGMTNRGIDCSGFTHLLYRLAGKRIPRNAAHQYLAATLTSNPQPADLLFSETDGKIDHVMLYLGDDKLIESAKSAGGVRMRPLPSNPRFYRPLDELMY